MTPAESRAWRPELPGWSDDILPFYARLAEELSPEARVVEVGVGFGRSIVFLAHRLIKLGKTNVELWGIDPWPRHPLAGAPYGPLYYANALGMMLAYATAEELSLLRLVRAPSEHASRMFARRSVDVVFIDADHDEHAVRLDIESWMPKVRQGGLLCGHDFGGDKVGVTKVVHRIFGGAQKVEGLVWHTRIP